jgi:hypothetical protein
VSPPVEIKEPRGGDKADEAPRADQRVPDKEQALWREVDKVKRQPDKEERRGDEIKA